MLSKKANKKRHNLSLLVAGTGIVTFWWSIWGLLERHFFPNTPDVRYAVGIIVGLFLIYVDDRRLHELV